MGIVSDVMGVTVDRGTQSTRAPTALVTEASFWGYCTRCTGSCESGDTIAWIVVHNPRREKRQECLDSRTLRHRAHHHDLTFLSFIATLLVRLFDCKHFIEGKRS